jgi:glutaconate CoA-transferase subunit A
LSKVLPLAEALRRHVPDGASVVLGTALECLIPFGAAHELIRQRRRDLTLVGPISDICFEQLIAAGCARAIVAAGSATSSMAPVTSSGAHWSRGSPAR